MHIIKYSLSRIKTDCTLQFMNYYKKHATNMNGHENGDYQMIG